MQRGAFEHGGHSIISAVQQQHWKSMVWCSRVEACITTSGLIAHVKSERMRSGKHVDSTNSCEVASTMFVSISTYVMSHQLLKVRGDSV